MRHNHSRGSVLSGRRQEIDSSEVGPLSVQDCGDWQYSEIRWTLKLEGFLALWFLALTSKSQKSRFRFPAQLILSTLFTLHIGL